MRQIRRERPEAPVEVVLRAGTYFLRRPLRLGPDDGGESAATNPKRPENLQSPRCVTWRAYAGETPVVSGGRRITGFRETEVNGCRAWLADLPPVREGTWWFQQLFVNGERRLRPRRPREGFYRIAGVPDPPKEGGINAGSDTVEYVEGDIDPAWKNLQDIEAVAVQFWTASRMWLKSVDAKTRHVTFDRPTRRKCLVLPTEKDGGTGYYLEGIVEALENPGEWVLDRPAGKLYYLPLPGESIKTAEVIAPVQSELLRITGTKTRPAAALRFEGITFSHTEWRYPAGQAASNQAAWEVPAAVTLAHARDCVFSLCGFVNLGTWGVELEAGAVNCALLGCLLRENGGGGVRIWHGTRRNRVEDCEIHRMGRIFLSAIAILVGKSSGNRILHNHIHDQFYSGMSVGWTWGYGEGEAYGNIVEHNHIHDIGQGALSDMGGIYTLGPSQGTRLRFNHIHDIRSRGYGGWGIYTDEGSTDVLIERNLVYDCSRCPFNQHYGRDNLVENNIFAFGAAYGFTSARGEPHNAFTFRRNLMLIAGGGAVGGGYANPDYANFLAEIDRNCWFHLAGKRLDFCGHTRRQWQAMGFDRNSLFADPGFRDPAKRDFRLKKNSPVFAKLGFLPFDVSDAGPRYAPGPEGKQ